MARLFGFRRRDLAADDGAAEPVASADRPEPLVPAGAAGATATIDLDRPPQGTTSGATAASGTTPASSAERSDPAQAATEGVWEVIRPAAIVPEHAARRVLVELARRDLTNGGEWQSEPQLWSRFDRALGPDGSGSPELMGTIHVTYGTPTKYEITLYRVTVTAGGVAAGWTVASLTDEALGFGGLTLAECPRAMVQTPPRPYTY